MASPSDGRSGPPAAPFTRGQGVGRPLRRGANLALVVVVAAVLAGAGSGPLRLDPPIAVPRPAADLAAGVLAVAAAALGTDEADGPLSAWLVAFGPLASYALVVVVRGDDFGWLYPPPSPAVPLYLAVLLAVPLGSLGLAVGRLVAGRSPLLELRSPPVATVFAGFWWAGVLLAASGPGSVWLDEAVESPAFLASVGTWALATASGTLAVHRELEPVGPSVRRLVAWGGPRLAAGAYGVVVVAATGVGTALVLVPAAEHLGEPTGALVAGATGVVLVEVLAVALVPGLRLVDAADARFGGPSTVDGRDGGLRGRYRRARSRTALLCGGGLLLVQVLFLSLKFLQLAFGHPVRLDLDLTVVGPTVLGASALCYDRLRRRLDTSSDR